LTSPPDTAKQFSTKICPLSGLTITECSNWTDIPIGFNYTVTYKRYGSQILFSQSKGNFADMNLDKYFEIREELIPEIFPHYKKFIEIRDFQFLTGAPTHEQRIKQTQKFIETQTQCLAFYGCNASLPLRTAFNIGMAIRKKPYPMAIYPRFDRAIREAKKLMDARQANQYVLESDFIRNPKWYFSPDSGQNWLDYKIIPDRVIYSKYFGTPTISGVKTAIQILDDILQAGHFKKETYIRIADYTHVKSSGWKVRQTYIQGLLNLEKKYHLKPRTTYIVGAHPAVRMTMTFVQRILKY